MSNRSGALPDTMLRQYIEQGRITGAKLENVSPASLDLTLSEEVYEIDAFFLPQPGESVRECLKNRSAQPVSLTTALRTNCLYLAKLNESLVLPGMVYGYCNPKSSTGRLDVHVRVLADGVGRYDSVTPKGFSGELWVAVVPRSFSVLLHPGTPLTQLRLFTADTRLSEVELEAELHDGLVWHPTEDRMLLHADMAASDHDGSVMLTALIGEGISGYECIARPGQVLDVAKIRHYESGEFFRLLEPRNGVIYLSRGRFYILSGAERVRIPPTLASEMVSMDDRCGDFRSHYAGFLDPGWGWGADGEGRGRPFTLEVRPFEDLAFRRGQPIAKIRFEQMLRPPSVHYDSASKLSHYVTQTGPKLGKQFI